MPFFSKVFKQNKDGVGAASKKQPQQNNGYTVAPPKRRFVSTWNSKEVVPEEVEELIHACTLEMKSRAEALDTPFLLLPFRPEIDSNSSRMFIGNFFKSNSEGLQDYTGTSLQQELRLTEPEILCSILKWCWSRIAGGVVTWNVYEMFRVGEQESGMARNAFETFIPISVDSPSRKNILYDFFDLLAAIAAHGKVNGLGGRKLSRMAAWWAFELSDDSKGFDGGYRSWAEAANASSHLFFAYLRSIAPEAVTGITGISALPRSLQALVAQTEYPPETPTLMQTTTSKVVMIVDSVSPTPFALLRRAKHFEYRDEDGVLQHYSEYADPVEALTEECKRVLDSIADANQSTGAQSRRSNNVRGALQNGLVRSDESWSRFENMGFSEISPGNSTKSPSNSISASTASSPRVGGLQAAPRSRPVGGGRPTTPSWADFLSTGFVDDGSNSKSTNPALLLPPDKVLPPIGSGNRSRVDSKGTLDLDDSDLEPGELASITYFELDDSFWWVWMTSLASEEPSQRKAVFGRCALIETNIKGGRWLVMEEQVKGASPGPEEGAYIVEKKSRFGFSRRNKSTKRRSMIKPMAPPPVDASTRATSAAPHRGNMSEHQQAKISAAAAVLASKQNHRDFLSPDPVGQRRGRYDDATSTRTNSVLTLGLSNEAGPAIKWANAFDKEAVRKQYLGDNFAGRGISREHLASAAPSVLNEPRGAAMPDISRSPSSAAGRKERELPPTPPEGHRALPSHADAGSPAQLPTVPTVHVEEAREASEAAQIPLPQTTKYEEKAHAINQPSPSEMPLPSPAPYEDPALQASEMQETPRIGNVGRKPVPRPSNPIVHPAFRKQAADSRSEMPGGTPAAIAARSAWHTQSSPAASGDDHRKLQKRGGSAGFKKMFGKKREDPTPVQHGTSQVSPSLQPPSDSSVGRRISLLRRNPGPKSVDNASAVPSAESGSAPAAAPESVYSHPASPREPHMPVNYPVSEVASISHVGSEDLQEHEREFARFDQGPLTDAPAFVPSESTDSIDDRTPYASRYQEHGSDYLNPRGTESQSHSAYATPLELDTEDDAVSELSAPISEVEEEEAAPAVDRWAQIRRNAAERAARISEDQSRRSQDQSFRTERTDDGETSGEETIESRVARIKARVAELTGNIDRSQTPAP